MIGHEHVNHALLEIKCVCLLCFMLASFAFMEKEECGCLVFPNLEDELVGNVVLVLVFHDFSWDQGVNWWIRLQKDEKFLLFEG